METPSNPANYQKCMETTNNNHPLWMRPRLSCINTTSQSGGPFGRSFKTKHFLIQHLRRAFPSFAGCNLTGGRNSNSGDGSAGSCLLSPCCGSKHPRKRSRRKPIGRRHSCTKDSSIERQRHPPAAPQDLPDNGWHNWNVSRR
ncbi:UNVERIFIED_CONTAM: hypothetical protein Sindi_1264000, partial [Sesamum indicum]